MLKQSFHILSKLPNECEDSIVRVYVCVCILYAHFSHLVKLLKATCFTTRKNWYLLHQFVIAEQHNMRQEIRHTLSPVTLAICLFKPQKKHHSLGMQRCISCKLATCCIKRFANKDHNMTKLTSI